MKNVVLYIQDHFENIFSNNTLNGLFIYFAKGTGLTKLSILTFAAPLTAFFVWFEVTAAEANMNIFLLRAIGVLFLADTATGIYRATQLDGEGVSGTQFEFKKLFKIISKMVLLAFLIGIAYGTGIAAKNGYNFLVVELSGDLVLISTCITELKSALENMDDVYDHPIIKYLLRVLRSIDDLLPKAKSKTDGKETV